jgi:hypothetical protein
MHRITRAPCPASPTDVWPSELAATAESSELVVEAPRGLSGSGADVRPGRRRRGDGAGHGPAQRAVVRLPADDPDGGAARGAAGGSPRAGRRARRVRQGPGAAIRRRRSWPRAPGSSCSSPRALRPAGHAGGGPMRGRAARARSSRAWRAPRPARCTRSLDDGAFELPRSRASTWRVEGQPPAVTSLRLDLAELSGHLRNSGWQPAGSGAAWYALRFRAPIRSSHPEPVGARRRS